MLHYGSSYPEIVSEVQSFNIAIVYVMLIHSN